MVVGRQFSMVISCFCMVQGLWEKVFEANVCIRRHSRKAKLETSLYLETSLDSKVKHSFPFPSLPLCRPSLYFLFLPFLFFPPLFSPLFSYPKVNLFIFQGNNFRDAFTFFPWDFAIWYNEISFFLEERITCH